VSRELAALGARHYRLPHVGGDVPMLSMVERRTTRAGGHARS
jgi:hypothetical protein